jgi:hypothetical protein
MIAEAIAKLQGMFKESVNVEVRRIPGDNPDRLLIVKGDGTHEFTQTTPGYRTLKSDSLEALIQVANDHFDARVKENSRMALLYGQRSAELVFDTERANERIMVELPETREQEFFSAAFNNPKGVDLSVKEAAELFDTTLRECMPHEGFLKSIERLKTHVERSIEVSRSANNSLTGGIETMRVDDNEALAVGRHVFKVQRYRHADIKQRLPLAVYLRADLESGRWVFKTVESAWAEFLRESSELIGDRLRKGVEGKGIPVIRSSLSQTVGASCS